MKKILNLYFPENENIFVSIITFPLKLTNTLIAIICYIGLSPLFIFNYFINSFVKFVGKVVALFRSKV